MSNSSPAVETIGLSKEFGEIRALNGLDLTVEDGEIFGLIGPNGAGKTTALRVISTIIQPTSGKVSVFGRDVVSEAVEVRRMISYLPEEAGAYRNLTGMEYLRFMAQFYTSEREKTAEMVGFATKICELGDRLRDRVKTYSKGMSRRLLLARALMMRPRIVILDEPTSGLDVIQSFKVRELIRRRASLPEITILLSSHDMLEVETLCNRVAIIDGGKALVEGSPRELIAEYRASNLEEVFMEVTHNG